MGLLLFSQVIRSIKVIFLKLNNFGGGYITVAIEIYYKVGIEENCLLCYWRYIHNLYDRITITGYIYIYIYFSNNNQGVDEKIIKKYYWYLKNNNYKRKNLGHKLSQRDH